MSAQDWIVACAYCGMRVRIRDLPITTNAECWACFLRNTYRLPLLPWWKVAP